MCHEEKYLWILGNFGRKAYHHVYEERAADKLNQRCDNEGTNKEAMDDPSINIGQLFQVLLSKAINLWENNESKEF